MEHNMRPAHVIEITTPKKFVLDGLWFGPLTPKRVIIWVHGLSSTLFKNIHFVDSFVTKDTAFLIINTRGHDTISKIGSASSKAKSRIGGGGQEVFTECVDDIQGAVNFARRHGVREIYVGGISTGCQKSIYWAAKSKNTNNVKGIILLAPISDYAADTFLVGKKKIENALTVAQGMVGRGKKHELLPSGLWHWPIDAQRFISLYSGKSAEEIFTYWDKERNPRTYASVQLPIIALFAENDEYADRSAEKLVEWFAKNTQSRYFRAGIVPKVGHSFRGGEDRVARLIRQWISR